jgi:hypothetical protein
MAYCGPLGIPWSEFLSWPKVDRDAAILWQQHRDRLCKGCGTHPDEWDPARGGHPRAFVATVHTCPGCGAVESQSDRLLKDAPKGSAVALRRQVGGAS